MPAGGIPKSVFVKDTQVVAPSRMIAVGDSQLLWGSPTRLITGSTIGFLSDPSHVFADYEDDAMTGAANWL